MGGRGPADGIGGSPIGDDVIDDVTDTGIEELTEGADDDEVQRSMDLEAKVQYAS